MKKARILTNFLISAILLSGCKASETSENSDAVSVSTSTSETSAESSVVSSAVSSVESASSDVSTAISSSSTVISSVESTSTAPTEPTSTTSEPEPTSEPISTPTETSEPAPEWTETPTSGTMYVNTSCFSRAKAVLGAEKVKQYFLNDAVTVTARATSASTGDIYYKIAEGEFIHSDYLSSSKIVIQQPSDQTSSTTPSNQTPSSGNNNQQTNNQPSSNGTHKNGDFKTVNGKQYIYIEGEWLEWGGGAVQESGGDYVYNPADDHPDPNTF